MLYYIDDIGQIDDSVQRRLLPYIPDQRLSYANTYKFRDNRVQSLTAYAALRAGLFIEFGYRTVPVFSVTATGKPYLANVSNIHFNLSHCKAGIACGIDESEIGVDIQEYIQYDESLGKYFLSPQENIDVQNGNSNVEFTKLWTLKESYGKYTGDGICYDMPGHFVKTGVCKDGCISDSFLFDSFVLSVTATKSMKPKRLEVCRLLEILEMHMS